MKGRIGICTAALTIALHVASSATAQTAQEHSDGPQPDAAPAPAADNVIGEIIVTAQRRPESLQKVPLTIQVVQAGDVANAGLTSPLQLTSLLPGVQVGESGPASQVYIRGVGAYASTAAISPAIPYYIDGVYVARSQSVPSEFYDIDRLEVLKGPQGTLYGRNASGGAINFLTQRPELGKFDGHADLEIGNYSNRNGEVAINVPVGETFALRASGSIVDKGGYTSADLSDDVHRSGRLKALWQPTGSISLLLNGSYGHIGGRGTGAVVLNKDIQCSNATPAAPGCSNVRWYPWLDVSSLEGKKYTEANGTVIPAEPFTIGTTGQSKQNLRFWNLSAELNYNMGPVTLTVLPAYRYAKMQYATNFSSLYSDGYGLGAEPARPETSKQTSIETRLTGNGTTFNWVAGLYYFNEDQFQQYTTFAGDLANVGVDAGFGTRSYAAFGQSTYAVTDRIRLIGGVRYTSDKRSIEDGQSFFVSPSVFNPAQAPFLPASVLACAFPVPTTDRCIIDQYQGSKTYTNVSWKAGIEADVLQDSLAYATVARGFKAGGFNTQSITSDPGGPTTVGSALEIRPELLTAYEVGLKNRFLDDQLQLNLEGFYWDYKDHQEPKLGLTPSGTANLIFFNAGAARIFGGDIDILARPWQGATVNLSVEYANSKYGDFLINIPYLGSAPVTGCPYTVAGPTATINCSGFQVARTPEWTGSVGVKQNFALSRGRIIANANVTFASSRFTNIEFTAIERAKAYAKLDSSLTYEAPGGSWAITAFVRNVTNAAIYTSSQTNPISSVVASSIDPPRTYGGRLAIKF